MKFISKYKVFTIFCLQCSFLFTSGKGYNPKFYNFEQRKCCSDEYIYLLKDRIEEIKYLEDTTKISLIIIEDCCAEYKASGIIRNDTIFLSYIRLPDFETVENGKVIETITFCECLCCFTLTFSFNQIQQMQYTYKVNGKILELTNERFKVVQDEYYEIENGDTINLVDKNGLKQGLHREKDLFNQLTSEVYFEDSKAKYGLLHCTYHGYKSIESKRMLREDGTLIDQLYWKNGNLRRERIKDVDGNEISLKVYNLFGDSVMPVE